ncbi:hypothetical protein SDC9_87462 [bioreactor metagenome]|uniref:DUF2939 domain-containing protein n=1 Tax=bioreactor metagenome TaxID=1076179 RepID=A0A644ZTB4_9ZZZZ
MKNQKNMFVAVVGAALLGAAALVYASPYMALNSIKKALDARDAEAFSEYVDFPVLRENLKGKLMASISKKMPAAPDSASSNPFSNFGQAIGGMVVGAAVDSMVSPAGVMTLMGTGQFGPHMPKTDKPQDADDTSTAQKSQEDRSFSVDYQGFNKVRVYRKSDPDAAFIFRREGIMGWKLINVDM